MLVGSKLALFLIVAPTEKSFLVLNEAISTKKSYSWIQFDIYILHQFVNEIFFAG
jgi:hypothetical protein